MRIALWGAAPPSGPAGIAVECEGCGKRVVLKPAMPGAGWRIVHECATRQIETIALRDEPPAWRYVEIAAAGV